MVFKSHPSRAAGARVALLTNSLSPHTLSLCEAIGERVGELRAFVSAAADRFHGFPCPQASFPIVVQRSLNTFRLRHRVDHFSVSEEVHIPVDTLPQLRRYNPDVIVTCQFGARTLSAIVYRLLRPHVRLLLWATLSTHTERERTAFRNLLRRWMVRHVDGAFVNGASGERYLRELGFTGQATNVPYAIDDTLFRSSAYTPQNGHRRLLFCGRVDPIKGILPFTRTLHRWCAAHPDERISFTIVGDGKDTAAIRALSPLPNLTLELLPRVNQDQLAPHYHRADLFAFPSMMDEWGVVVNEALSAGLPVLGSIYSQAAVELVSDGANGWLCDPRSEDNVYAALDRALKTPVSELQSMSAYAQCTAREMTPAIVATRAARAIAAVCEENAVPDLTCIAELPVSASAP